MTNLAIQITEATAEDIPQLCDLLALLFAQELDFTPDRERQSAALHMIIGHPEVGLVLCARDSSGIVGTASILFTVSTAEGGRAAFLEDVIVHPTRRGQGIGELLLNEAIRRARAATCKRITLLTDSTNQSAIRFYTRTGFTRSQMVPFRKIL